MENRQYKCILEKVRKMAEKSSGIDAAFIIGSQVRRTETADEYSDLDFVVIINAPETYIEKQEWVSETGEPLCVFIDQEPGFATRDIRVLFKNFLEADFVFLEYKQLETEWVRQFAASMLSPGYETVIDKKNIISLLEPYMNQDVQILSDTQLLNEINDFFFHCNWIKKKIGRGALFTAHSCLNTYMKKKLVTIIESYEKEERGKEYNTWFEGRFIEKWASPEIIEKLKTCFSGYSNDEILKALKNCIYLYKDLAEKLCIKRGIDFPGNMINKILHHIGIRQ